MKTITEVCHLCNGTGEVFLETLVPCPKCDKNETNPARIWCEKCSKLEKYIEDLKNDTLSQGCGISDFIFHRYYDHKIIPLQNKYADLRKGQEEWYDGQIRKGLYDQYQYGVLGRSGPIDPSQFQ
tara:strand:- start:279 stop:653 length:375 start_codon:yes stop_codon:yes gene_type:complete